MADSSQPPADRQERILDATLRLLADRGISGVSIRAVAREADVAVGLVNYYFGDKVGLIRAALERIGEHDLQIADPAPELAPSDRLVAALRRVADPELLTTEYLSLRLQLWALARAHPDFAAVNAAGQGRYRDRLASLIAAARPGLDPAECARRAFDIDVLQNGLWLTALLGLDADAVRRCVARTEEIALAP